MVELVAKSLMRYRTFTEFQSIFPKLFIIYQRKTKNDPLQKPGGHKPHHVVAVSIASHRAADLTASCYGSATRAQCHFCGIPLKDTQPTSDTRYRTPDIDLVSKDILSNNQPKLKNVKVMKD